jgi:hypothetical protein
MVMMAIFFPVLLSSLFFKFFPKTSFLKVLQFLGYKNSEHGGYIIDYLRECQPIKPALIAVGWTLLISLPLYVLDYSNYKLLTREGYIERGYASFTTIKKSWNDIAKVETGWYFKSKSHDIILIYNIIFDDGYHIELFLSHPFMYPEDKLTQIEIADSILR